MTSSASPLEVAKYTGVIEDDSSEFEEYELCHWPFPCECNGCLQAYEDMYENQAGR